MRAQPATFHGTRVVNADWDVYGGIWQPEWVDCNGALVRSTTPKVAAKCITLTRPENLASPLIPP